MYVLLGSNGNITSKAARILLSHSRSVRVVGRSAERLAALKQAGADLAIGDATDTNFLASAFKGATAVFAMLPPVYSAPDMRAEQNRLGEAIAQAIAKSGVTKVVNLSSSGAHLSEGTGPVVALHLQEQRLNALEGVDVLHLRPGYFFENHFSAIDTIKTAGVYADRISSKAPIATVGTGDIAIVVARELAAFKTTGKQVLHLRAPKFYTQAEAAAILGKAIGNAELKHVQADPAQAKAGMVQFGFSPDVADQFEEMSRSLSVGNTVDAVIAGPTEITPTTLEQFAASIFAPAFLASA